MLRGPRKRSGAGAARSGSTCIPCSRSRRSSIASPTFGNPLLRGSELATVVGVVFQPGGKVYSFDPGGLELRWDERVICQTSRGREYGRVVQTPHEIPDEELTGPLKRVVRRAGPADDEQVKKNRVEAKR